MKRLFCKIAANKLAVFINELEILSKRHVNNLALYGEAYENTLEHDITNLQISWIELKANFLIEVFRL